MFYWTTYRVLRALSLALAALLVCPLAMADDSRASDSALFHTHDDPELEWGPCPADFLPDDCAATVLQGDPSERNADVFLRIPPGEHVAHHWHTSAERMVLVSGEFHLTYDGHETRVARPGTYMYGPAKLPHAAYCADGDPCVLFIAFEEPVDAIATAESMPGE